MPSAFLDVVEEQFGSQDLYQVLGVDKTAEEVELRRAYRRLSLRVHPDRASPDQVASATEKFQTLGKIHSILTDKDKRAIYDEDGTIDEDSSIFDQERDWSDYWRLLFPKITVDDITSFEKKYKGSEEEKEDLKRAYLQHNGDMDRIMEEVLCAGSEDEPRFTELLREWIADETVPDLDNFTSESEKKKRKRKARYRAEEKEAKKMRMNGTDSADGDGDLLAIIRAKQTSRERGMNSFFDRLEEKYTTNDGGTSGSKKRAGASRSGSKKKKTSAVTTTATDNVSPETCEDVDEDTTAARKQRKGKGRRKM